MKPSLGKGLLCLVLLFRTEGKSIAESGGQTSLRLQAVVRSAVNLRWIPPQASEPLAGSSPIFQVAEVLDLGQLQVRENGGLSYGLFVQSSQGGEPTPIPLAPHQTQVRIPAPKMTGRVPAATTRPTYTVSIVAY